MKSTLNVLLLAALSAPFAQAQTAPSSAPASAATSSQAAQLATEARSLAQQARSTYPANSANIDQPLWKQAAERVEAAVQAAPGDPEILKLRAQIYTEVGFWKQAESAWQAYFAAVPAVAGQEEARAAANVQYNLGYAAYTRQLGSQASTYFKNCLNLDPQNLSCVTWAARTALEGGDYAQAQTLYTQALSLSPADKSLNYFALIAKNAATYGPAATSAFSRAYANLDAGRKAEALSGFQEAARTAPTFLEAQREAGRLALELGNAEAALQAYQALSALPGATAADRYNLGLAQEGQQYGMKAAQTFRSAYAKYAAGDKSGAEAGFLQATTENVTYGKAWAWLGRVRYEAKNYGGAAEAYARAVAIDPNDKTSAYYLKLAQQGK